MCFGHVETKRDAVSLTFAGDAGADLDSCSMSRRNDEDRWVDYAPDHHTTNSNPLRFLSRIQSSMLKTAAAMTQTPKLSSNWPVVTAIVCKSKASLHLGRDCNHEGQRQRVERRVRVGQGLRIR